MKFSFRVPSIRKRIAARTSWKHIARNSLGLKAPRGWGWVTNPRKAAYNRIYNRTTTGCLVVLLGLPLALFAIIGVLRTVLS
ncbi:MAG: hypothetical protein WCH98_08030 [Verrucomicrobiota bacterium]